jgi:hypothetical protein
MHSTDVQMPGMIRTIFGMLLPFRRHSQGLRGRRPDCAVSLTLDHVGKPSRLAQSQEGKAGRLRQDLIGK